MILSPPPIQPMTLPRLVEFDLVIAELFHLSSDALDNALFFAALAGDCNHVTQELGHIVLVAFRGSSNGIKINVHETTSVKKLQLYPHVFAT